MSLEKVTAAPGAHLQKAKPNVGAPAHHTQSSRKGKKAWRKHVDIKEIEDSMEGLRAEERILGSILQKKTDDELFQVDVRGDEQIRKSRPRFSTTLLTSTKILQQRSAAPVLFSRLAPSNHLKRKLLTHEEKGRLLRMGKRPRKGPLNAIIDPTEVGSGSAMLEVSEAARQSGTYDVWEDSTAQGTPVKQPKTPHPRWLITLPAVPAPHEGTSYNPLATFHQELLLTAHKIEERRLREAEKLEETKRKMDEARSMATLEEDGVAPGMSVQEADDETDGEEAGEEGRELPPVKVPQRKTRQERRKAEKLRAEKRTLAEKAVRKRMVASVDSAKALRKALGRNLAARERLRAQRQEKLQEQLRHGLAGQRLGRHKVSEGEVDVQLGEDLSESLRTLKPEGNLFRDRFLSMQHRALIEPRVRVVPKKRKMNIKEYEKHSYKRFDRDQ